MYGKYKGATNALNNNENIHDWFFNSEKYEKNLL